MKIKYDEMQKLRELLEVKPGSYLEEVILEWVADEGIDKVLAECVQMKQNLKRRKV